MLIACPISYATDPTQSGVMLYPTIKVKLVHKSPDNPQLHVFPQKLDKRCLRFSAV